MYMTKMETLLEQGKLNAEDFAHTLLLWIPEKTLKEIYEHYSLELAEKDEQTKK